MANAGFLGRAWGVPEFAGTSVSTGGGDGVSRIGGGPGLAGTDRFAEGWGGVMAMGVGVGGGAHPSWLGLVSSGLLCGLSDGGGGGCCASGGLGLAGLFGLGVSRLRCRRSSVIVSRGGGGLVCTGKYFSRNLWLRVVILPEPSTRTTYWSNWRTSITTPVLSHFVGYGPVWFWMRTWLPTARGGSLLVCSDHPSTAVMWRFRRASSLVARVCG